MKLDRKAVLSVVIPCYNEESTIEQCVGNVLEIQDESLEVEIIIVDDGSSDGSYSIIQGLEAKHDEIRAVEHSENQGKGAALSTGFEHATGDFVAIQDADLEYNPNELKDLIVPLINGDADVVFGSRFISSGAHRVLYFWHSVGNRLLTLLSNMLTDLNLTDMETCYKVFKRDIIQKVTIEEKRFGFEPEIVAKISQLRVRIYEMGVSYRGRTYEEGKKIGFKDALRAVYCILHYNVHKAAWPLQFLLFLIFGSSTSILGAYSYYAMRCVKIADAIAYIVTSIGCGTLLYFICVLFLFRHRVRWSKWIEIAIFTIISGGLFWLNFVLLEQLFSKEFNQTSAKLISGFCLLILGYIFTRKIVFPEPPLGDWKPQEVK